MSNPKELFKERCLESTKVMAKAVEEGASHGIGEGFMRSYLSKHVPVEASKGRLVMREATPEDKASQIIDLLYAWSESDIKQVIGMVSSNLPKGCPN